MEATLKNVSQLEYEARNREIDNEYTNRQHEATKQYYEEIDKISREIEQVRKQYQTEREEQLNVIDEKLAIRNQLRRSGHADHSMEMEENYLQERMAQRVLADLKETFRYDMARLKELARHKRMAYESLCNINRNWLNAEQAKNRTAFAKVLAKAAMETAA